MSLEHLFNGLMLGMIYVLIAIGIGMIFGMMNFVNFGHGAFYALGAYLAYTIGAAGGSFWLALVLAPLLVGILGTAVERTLLQPLHGGEQSLHLLVTFGLALICQELTILIWGPIGKPVSVPAFLRGGVDLGFTVYPRYRVFVVAFTVVVALVLWVCLERTRLGAIIRAGTERAEMVNALGINIGLVFTSVFGLGCAMAGLAGVLAAPLVGVNPSMGMSVILLAFVVVVIGGLSSFAGAVVGGLLVGVVQALSTLYIPAASELVIFLVMAVVLILRPHGLMGQV